MLTATVTDCQLMAWLIDKERRNLLALSRDVDPFFEGLCIREKRTIYCLY